MNLAATIIVSAIFVLALSVIWVALRASDLERAVEDVFHLIEQDKAEREAVPAANRVLVDLPRSPEPIFTTDFAYYNGCPTHPYGCPADCTSEENRRRHCDHVWPSELDEDAPCEKGCGATYGLWSK